MIGDIGGFLEGLLLMFSFLASPISSKFYEYTIAEMNYKKINEEFAGEKPKGRRQRTHETSAVKLVDEPDLPNPFMSIKSKFGKMKLGTPFKVFEPCFGFAFYCCKNCKKKRKFMKKAVEKFEDELDVTKLLPQLRAMSDLLKGLLKPE